jgi:hypothetical protein
MENSSPGIVCSKAAGRKEASEAKLINLMNKK